MTRRGFIEMIRRQIYGGQPSDDATISENLVNEWLNQAIGLAAKTNYKENIAVDGIAFLNNSFFTRFTGLAIESDQDFSVWKITLPQIPLGIGTSQGVNALELRDVNGEITRPFIPISASQRTYFQNMRPIQNKVLYYSEGKFLYAITTIMLNDFTANVIMVSGGDSTDLDSELNVPADYYPVMVEYLQKQLMLERNVPVDVQNEGTDVIKSV